MEEVPDQDTYLQNRNTSPQNPQNILEPSDDDENDALNQASNCAKKARKKSAKDNKSNLDIQVIKNPDKDAKAELE